MKISKLFHWLYGFVMLLPIFAIGSTCLISTFNMASKEESEIHYKYETNDVNVEDDLIIGNAYCLEISNLQIDQSQIELTGYILNFNKFYCSNDVSKYIDDIYLQNIDLTILPFFNLYINDGACTLFINYPSDESFYSVGFEGDISEFNIELNFVLSYKSLYILQDFGDANVFSKCENIPIDYVETHNVSVQDVFYDSVEKVQEMSIFSWAYDSFLVAPFQYVLVLFGVPSNHVIVELLSYWLSVSIIWLVFDVIMYIPLLVHRWLDKGVLE